jgi:hypothetical protein
MLGYAMNRKHHVVLATLMVAGLLAGGCGSPQINRIDRDRAVYESWPLEIQQAVLDGKVEIGMTPAMVVMSWGQPTEKLPSPTAGNEEIWIWRKGGSDGMVTPLPAGPMIGMGGSMGGVGISTGSGGTVLGTNTGIGLGGGGITMGGGMGGGAIITPPTPIEEKEVVFRDGVVYRADAP